MANRTITLTMTWPSGDADFMVYLTSGGSRSDAVGYNWGSTKTFGNWTLSWSGDVQTGGTETVTIVGPDNETIDVTVHSRWYSESNIAGPVLVEISGDGTITTTRKIAPSPAGGQATDSDNSTSFTIYALRATWSSSKSIYIDNVLASITNLYDLTGNTPLAASVNQSAVAAYNATIAAQNKKIEFVRFEFSFSGTKSPSFRSPNYSQNVSIQNPYDSTSTGTLSSSAYFKTVDSDEPEETKYKVIAIASPSGGGSASGGGEYNENTSATVVATTNSGYTFGGWSFSDGTSDSGTSVTKTITSDITAIAKFNKIDNGSGLLIWMD